MSIAITDSGQIVYYNLETGKRTTADFGLAYPDKVETIVLPNKGIRLQYLERGESTPPTLEYARAALADAMALAEKDARTARIRARRIAKKRALADPNATLATPRAVRKVIIKKVAVARKTLFGPKKPKKYWD